MGHGLVFRAVSGPDELIAWRSFYLILGVGVVVGRFHEGWACGILIEQGFGEMDQAMTMSEGIWSAEKALWTRLQFN